MMKHRAIVVRKAIPELKVVSNARLTTLQDKRNLDLEEALFWTSVVMKI